MRIAMRVFSAIVRVIASGAVFSTPPGLESRYAMLPPENEDLR